MRRRPLVTGTLAALVLASSPALPRSPAGPGDPPPPGATTSVVGRAPVDVGAAAADRVAEVAPNRPAPWAERARDTLASLGPWAPLGFIALFVLTCVLCLPGAFLTVAAGALFGLVRGFVYVWIGGLLGATAAFFIGRRFAREWTTRRIASRPLLVAIERAVTEEGWKIVALSRLAPGSPFFLLNYLYGLTRVRFRDYFWATAVSMIPGTLLLVYLGSLGQLAITGRIRTVWDWLLWGIGLVAIALAVTLITRRARAALREKLAANQDARPVPDSPRDSQ